MHPLRSPVSSFVHSLFALLFACVGGLSAAQVALVEQSPVGISHLGPNIVLVDFGRAAFGNLKLTPPVGTTGTITVRFGEKLKDGRIDTKPPGTVRYNVATVRINGNRSVIVAPPADARNTEQVSEKHRPPC